MLAATADDLHLMVRLVRRDPRLAHDPPSPAAIERLAEAAPAEGLAVTLLAALDALPFLPQPGAERRRALEARRQRQHARTPVLLAALDRVTHAFDRAGIPMILLKGPSLAERHYGGLDAREFMDLDLLVTVADRQRAGQAIERAGFARRSRVLVHATLTSWFVHAFDYGQSGAGLDLHWRLSRHPSLRLDERALWQARQRARIAGRDVHVLADGDDIVFGALSLLRDIERGRPKAKNVVDLVQIAAAADGALDWDALLDRSRRDGTRGPLVNVLTGCLEAANAQSLVPNLSAALTRHAARRIAGAPSASPFRFAPDAGGLGNKWWAARVYDTSFVAWAAWWAASLPFRLAVHQRPRAAASPKPHA